MKLCEWQDVMKQSQNGMLLKDLNFSIEARQHLGIKFTQDERQYSMSFWWSVSDQRAVKLAVVLRRWQVAA